MENVNSTLALELLSKNKTVAQRAESYFTSIERNIKRDVIDALQDKKDKLEDKLFELKDFTLETNLNNGRKAMDKNDCEVRFKEIIDIEYQLTLLDLEIKCKQTSFNKYFKTKEINNG